MRRVISCLCLAPLLVLALLAACAQGQGPVDPAGPMEGCFWVGPYTRERPQTNLAFPDSGATYWSARYTVPEGAKLRLRGRFPHARYMSFVSYNSLKAPTHSIYDEQIRPAAGSVNPYLPGADRTAARRGYLLRLSARAAPDEPEDNKLYTAPRFDDEVALMYRVYVPDHGRDASGGVGLPQLELELADGTVLSGEPACAALQARRNLLLSPSGSRWVYRLARGQPWRAETFPAQRPPRWRAFYNTVYFQRCTYLGWCGGDPERLGGVYSNPQNGYLTLLANRKFGPLLVLEGRMPETPRTANGTATMPKAQLRYWSLCSNETFTQRVTDCAYDEQVPLGEARTYTVVVSRPADRPANAKHECGVAWLEWPEAGDGAGHEDDMLLILRNMLPAADFAHAVQRTQSPGDARATMQEYLPQARYMGAREFELRGCREDSGAGLRAPN